MSKKQRKFHFERHIEVSGYSRGFDNEPTFAEKILVAIIDDLLKIVKNRFQNLKVFIDGKEL